MTLKDSNRKRKIVYAKNTYTKNYKTNKKTRRRTTTRIHTYVQEDSSAFALKIGNDVTISVQLTKAYHEGAARLCVVLLIV